ncbi:hypothetical protein AGMMS49975_00460 [Clostridia bacterium]|nr:hypothetical protein AGMMS49975_00460 [Clostridia bacterium]
MRRHQQKHILELLETFEEALSEGLYADCQEATKSIGAFIEKIEGKGTRTVALLENYYETLIRVYNGEIGKKQLRKKIIQIENSVKNELKPNRLEIAFLPYNASMWDSLESIYLVAKEDRNCDVYVVPIPYFDKRSDGSFGKMHYEGNLYPENIPITNWQNYDIELHRPDVIFIHNPYDEQNYSTSVHPNFYSKRLRGLTDLLCYVPYFVLLEHDIVKHFATVPGCVYAHKIMVQSERICDMYIHAFREKFGNQLGKPEDKFVALGSPKFDAVMNVKAEDFELPDNWAKLIEKPNGTKKKVIFFNARFTDFTAGVENMLDRLKNVLETFKNRDDVVLWFRPHPLNLSVLKSMRPQFVLEYAALIDNYLKYEYGIYDESPILHRVISHSDGYFGDLSSVVSMYQKTEKPILLFGSELYQNSILAYCADFSGNKLLLTVSDGSLFINIDTDNGTVVPIATPKDNQEYMQYYTACDTGDRVFFSPYNARCIAVYEKSTRKFSYIPLDLYIGELPAPYCGWIIHYKNSLFFPPLNFPGILEYNLDNNSINVHTGWENEVRACAFENITTITLRGCPCVVGSKFLISCENSNAIMEFDLETYDWKIEKIGREKISYTNICFDGAAYWLIGRNKPVLVKKTHGNVEVLDLSKYALKNLSYSYVWGFVCGRYLWLIPCTGENLLKVDILNNCVVKDNYLQDYLSKTEDKPMKFTFAGINEGKIWIIPYIGNSLFSIDTSNDFEEELNLSVSPSATLEGVSPYLLSRNIFVESSLLNLDLFLNFIVNNETKKVVAESKGDKTAGENIYKYCLGLVMGNTI